MKFLLELVPCCGSPTAAGRRKAPGPPPPRPPLESEDEDDVASLVPLPPRRLTKRVRTAVVAAPRQRSRSSSAEWLPSLGVISEDAAVSTTVKGMATGRRKAEAAELVGSVRGGTGRQTRGSSRTPDGDRRRRDRDDYEYGRSSLPTTMIPAFSPTPFLF